ncbi:MAG: hypothetical protein J1F09_06655 [Oscillospiraceae bacterium]|nr:hypothetical protein [Oscillospiraceae bacterium]
MEERNDINKYRQKKKRRNLIIRLGIFLLVIVIAVLVIVNRETLFAPFKDMGLKVGKGGFPVMLPGSTQYYLGEMGESFYLLTDTYLYTYNGEGAEIASIQHGFQNPAAVSNDKRTLVYDKNGKSFKLFSRTGEIFKNSVEDSIVFAQIGNTGRTAVVTTSTRYSNFLIIYNSEGKQIFRWASPDEKIMGVCFGANDNSVFVSVVGEKNGELRGNLVRFDISNSESESWRSSIDNNITYSLERCSDGIYAVTSSGAYLFNEQTGELIANNSYTRQVYGIPETDGARVVIFRDSGSNGETAVAYNERLEAAYSAQLDNAAAFDVNGGRLYVLGGNKLSVYNSALEGIKIYELEDEYSNIKIINGSAYLLGYNTVRRVSL